MKRVLLAALLICTTAFTSVAQPATYRMTLEECLDYAFGYSYSRQSVKLNEEAIDEVYEQSKMERLPGLNASVGESVSHTNSSGTDWSGNYGLSSNVTLYQGGSISNAIEQNRLSKEQTAHRTSQYDNQLTIQVLQSFLTALGNEELLKYQEAVAHASLEQMKQGDELFSAGSIIESDYLLLRSQYASDTTSLTETRINRDNSLRALKNLMSMDPQVNLEIVYPDSSVVNQLLMLPSEDYVLERSMNSMPDLQISSYNVEIAETGVKISQAAFSPTLSLGASIGTGHSNNFSGYGSQISDRLNEQVGLTLSVPIFNKGRTRSQVAQSKIALRQAELDDKQTVLDVRNTVIQEYMDVVAASSKYQSSEIRQQAYLSSFDAFRKRFELGAITPVELLQQQNNYINAVNDYIQNKYSFILKRKILDVYMGERVAM